MRRLVWVAVSIALLSSPATMAGEFYVKHKGERPRVEAPDDMALVYVFRPASVGAAIKTWSFADEQFLGVSKSKGYYYAFVPPGKRTVWSKAENTSGVEVDLQAGETYYFKTAIRPGIGKARVNMTPIDAEEAEKYFAKCSLCEPTEEGRQRAVEIAANRLERAEENAEKKEEKARKKADES